MPSEFFKILGTVRIWYSKDSTPKPLMLSQILSVAVVLLWIVVATGTAKKSFTGELFHAPCLANLKPKERQSDRQELNDVETGT